MQFLMVISIVLLWVIVLLNLVLTLGIVRRLNTTSSTSGSETRERLQPGEPAPAFTAETLDGQQVSLATYAGKSVALHFLSTQCNPCREVLPDLLALAPLAARAGVDFIFVILDETEKARAFVEEFQITLPVLIAPREGSDFATLYKSTTTPSFCLVDGQGLVQAAGHPRMGGWKKLETAWRKQPSETIQKVPVAGR